ncbi:unnamed protein product [Bursaphelenchus okinawaensis]|uniref:LIM zinc-binding domain-containing protein n=1 Tax=Bursaphelenchus okinawaensis TaxID=465554 RepID=A0A811JVB4_9BILA|nr:unnamed protein product [Bursaphelenchus okinawaensis]CAG9084099.1 unnamed protein product [Bursaphelenchus okinawaensis]
MTSLGIQSSLKFCAACHQPILDQYLLNVLDQNWHPNCLRCVDCKEPQDESCFYKDDMILCRGDFTRRYGIRCAGCNMIIEREELVRKARNQVFHCQCFCCSVCQRVLDTGERLYIVDGKNFVCKNDYTPSKILGTTMTNRSSNDECSSDEEVDDHSDDHGKLTQLFQSELFKKFS